MNHSQITITKQKPPKNIEEKRLNPRFNVSGLMATEITKDLIFNVPVKNISLGGIFLEKKLITKNDEPSKIILHFPNQKIELLAMPLYDHIEKNASSFGTGYCFWQLDKQTEAELKNALKI
jgi:hypothetical protein